MNNRIIRIQSISIENIKNVSKGEVYLNETNPDSIGASVVGVYGQNGSGKTALIWAVGLVKDAMSGLSLPADTNYYVKQNSEKAEIQMKFDITIDERQYLVYYTLAFNAIGESVQISSESVDFSAKATDKMARITKTRIIGINYPVESSDLDNCFYGPDSRISEMVGNDKQIRSKLLVLQALAKEKKNSFIFNDKMTELLKVTFKDKLYFEILNTLHYFARMNLFVLNKNQESSFNMNLLPLSMRLCTTDSISKSDAVLVGLGQNKANPESFKIIKSIISQIDILIGSIVPGLKIEIIEKATTLNEKAEEEYVLSWLLIETE